MIQTIIPDAYEQSEDMPPEVFTKHLLTALKIEYINGIYPFVMLNLRTESDDYDRWWIDGVYDDNKVIGYFTIRVGHAGSPWKGYCSVFQYYIRAVNSKKVFFSSINPAEFILHTINKAKTNYFNNYTNENDEIKEWRRKAKELRIKILSK
jgi:hypothetical protein